MVSFDIWAPRWLAHFTLVPKETVTTMFGRPGVVYTFTKLCNPYPTVGPGMTSVRKYVPVRSSHETNLGTTLNMGAIGIEMYM